MTAGMNNIRIRYKGVDISIAQHNLGGITVQELGLILPHSKEWVIIKYCNTPTSLIEAITEAQIAIAKDIHKLEKDHEIRT